MIAARINVDLIRAHWSEILRVVASIRTGTVTASLIMRQLASYPRQNGVATALRELGRLERTLFMLDWIDEPELRRTTGQELNKGEARHSLARAVFIHRLGEIRDRTYENQQHRASGLNLLVTAIILWNTRYLERAVATLRQVEESPADPSVRAGLGARQPDRRLCLGRPAERVGKHRRIEAASGGTRANPQGGMTFLLRPLTCQIRTFRSFWPHCPAALLHQCYDDPTEYAPDVLVHRRPPIFWNGPGAPRGAP